MAAASPRASRLPARAVGDASAVADVSPIADLSTVAACSPVATVSPVSDGEEVGDDHHRCFPNDNADQRVGWYKWHGDDSKLRPHHRHREHHQRH